MGNMIKGKLQHPSKIKQLDFDSMEKKTRQQGRKHVTYYNIPASYDIETTSFTDQAGRPAAITYSHALNIDGYVFKMETWETFEQSIYEIADMADLDDKKRIIIYVHNLSYEFQFMKNHFEFDRVFSNGKSRDILTATTNFGVEFRCSYMLSGMALSVVATKLINYKIEKMTGDFDYMKIRTPNTPLSDEEDGYILNDVLIVEYYIRERLEEAGGDITKIPLTATGYVRNDMRERTINAEGKDGEWYRELMKTLTLEKEEYLALRFAFSGGYTHGNIERLKETMRNVHAKDFASSYPARMIMYKYPMSKGERYRVKDKEDFQHQLDYYCCLFYIEFDNIYRTAVEPYIPNSKTTTLINGINNNGRVESAEMVALWITDVDYESIIKSYAFDDYRVGTMYRYKRGYLPTSFVKGLIDMYEGKTKLKDLKGFEGDYNRSKENLNSAYGMTVMDIIQSMYEWDDEFKLSFESDVDVEDAIDRNNESRKRFLSYPWGVWITSYARHDLFDVIVKLGDDYIYSDTDSIYYLNKEKNEHIFNESNAFVIRALERACKHHKLDFEAVAPKDQKGRVRTLGIWEDDGSYTRFKTLGAKRYMVEYINDEGDREINITVSGVNKSHAVPYLLEKYGEDIFEVFDEGLIIPAGKTGKSTHTYIDDIRMGTVVDYLGESYDYVEESGIHLEETSYEMTIADELNEMIQWATSVK